MTGRERFMMAMRFEEPDRPPHFESMFELEQQAFGLKFPSRDGWNCTAAEKELRISTCMDIYERIVERYRWDALPVYWPWGDPQGVAAAKKRFGDRIAIGGMVGGGIWSIENILDWDAFAVDLMDHRDRIHAVADERCRAAIDKLDQIADAGADFAFLPNDIAFNGGPFVSPKDFAEIVTPYLERQLQHARKRGMIAIFHSDGMLMPVLDQILSCRPNALHSIDPMAGMDIAAVKSATRGKTALMGNVQCNLLQDGPRAKIRQSARYCLENASPGGGYVFSTSNTIFEGMPLANYEYMLEVFREFNAENAR